MNVTELFTDRLVLQVVDDSRAGQVLDYLYRNREFLAEWEVLRDSSFYSIDSQRLLLLQDTQQMNRGELFKVWIYRKSDPQVIIGTVTLSNIVRGAFLSCHLGYRLDGSFEGLGYMTEAIQEVVRYAFEELQLHRVEANIMPRNLGSLRVVQKLGFHEEGLAHKYLKIHGNWEDHIHMVRLNPNID
ncbi:ribosomal-protein-alanine N-acetyltransferase [Paenibacillus shirakamiensis]|uniref:Ribosomal-protein-alanine N-acetyltransferase n=1 Tax=Paenibacillus shirakamiensis TaxID=1265935 RepID=A0ABS4JGR9_9BACL|nr:GNAT family N-acetyltransferase [Paenibacillus shirakamiensis]MBP2000916.1 ribosomal-protein-alanine N-acetyltransferase [Paenibacillus shirakamiensis]